MYVLYGYNSKCDLTTFVNTIQITLVTYLETGLIYPDENQSYQYAAVHAERAFESNNIEMKRTHSVYIALCYLIET